MKPVKLLFLLWLLCNACISVHAQSQKRSQVKVYLPEERTARANMLGLLDVDHFIPASGGGIICDLTETELKKLKASKTKYEVLVDDVVKRTQAINARNVELAKAGKLDLETQRVAFDESYKTVNQLIQTPAAFKVWGLTAPVGAAPYNGGFYTLAQMVTAIDNLVAAYPGIAQKITVGASHESKGIYAVKISDNVATDEKLTERGALFTGLQHAREYIGGSSLIFFMQYLCEQYTAGNVKIQNLVNNREIYIIPCMNPDGYEKNRRDANEGGGNQRKNRRKNGADSSTNLGVDLNRNYLVDWGDCPGVITDPNNSCGSNQPSGGTYFGTGAFSEPESQAVRAFVLSRRIHIAIDQHAYGPYYSLPFGRPTLHTTDMTASEAKFYTYIPAVEGMYNGMRAGNSPESVGYEVAGGIKDWLLLGDIGAGSISKGKIYAMTGEGAGGDFFPPNDQIIQLCKGMVYQNIQLLYAAGAYMDIQDMDPLDIPALSNPKVTACNYKLTRVGLVDSIVKVSLIPIENVKYVGATVTLPVGTMPTFYDTHTGSINATLYNHLIAGMRIKYAWKIETGGQVYYDTVTRLYNPGTPVFTDNMEGTYATNWTSTSWNGATSTALAANNWNFSATGGAFAGTKYMTESPSGIYTTSATRNSTLNSVVNLGPAATTQAYLSFWVKHRAENFRDKMQVQVSTDGGTVWTAVLGNITVQEPNYYAADGFQINGQPSLTGIRDLWTKAIFDLSAYKGVTNLRLRLQMTSDADGGAFTFERDEGFQIDNLQIFKSSAPLVAFTLPVNFISVRGDMQPDHSIKVAWEASIDANHNYFEVEKSFDGNNFTPIGQVRTLQSPYSLLDRNPGVGNNYYRIKAYDKSGDFIYSKVINVIYSIGVKLAVYPNPIQKGDNFSIRIEDSRTSSLTIRITDVQGRTVYTQHVTDILGSREIKINTDLWHAGVYILKLTNTEGELITTQKVIKQ